LESRSTVGVDLGRGALRLLWQCVRVPTLTLLIILEPVVRVVFGLLALLGVLTALFWKLVGPPHFPFVLVLSISVGFGLALMLYHKVICLLQA
jgi:hypothetical protein